MLQIPIFLCWISIFNVFGKHFTFDATSRISTTDNWLHEEVPCIGDFIRFDNTLPVVAFMDHNVNVQSITLPDNGLIVFTDNGVDLGGEANWQCIHDDINAIEPQDAFFTRGSRHDMSFYNPANWIPDKKLFLHMNQVPSEHDDVTISSMTSAQIYLDIPVKVNTFQYYKRERMTTDDFNLLLRSMEGQFQINLARPWATESDQGGVQRLLADDAITVVNKDLEKYPDPEGMVNSNSNNKTLSTICSYIQCQGVQEQCIDSFVPFGHCCPVCGTRIRLVAWGMNLEKARIIVFNVLREMEPDAMVFATFERTKMDQFNSKYEITLISSHNVSLNEEFHKTAKDRILERLTLTMKTHHHQAILNVDVFSSKIDRSVRTVSKVVACLIYFTIIVALVGMYAYQNVELRVSSQNPFNPVIRYRRETDEVAIEMNSVDEDDLEEIHEDPEPKKETIENTETTVEDDVEDWRNINPNFSTEDVPDDEMMSGEEFEMKETLRKTYSENVNLKSPESHEEKIVESDDQKSSASSRSEEESAIENPLDINPNFEECSENIEDIKMASEDVQTSENRAQLESESEDESEEEVELVQF